MLRLVTDFARDCGQLRIILGSGISGSSVLRRNLLRLGLVVAALLRMRVVVALLVLVLSIGRDLGVVFGVRLLGSSAGPSGLQTLGHGRRRSCCSGRGRHSRSRSGSGSRWRGQRHFHHLPMVTAAVLAALIAAVIREWTMQQQQQ